MEYAVFFIMLLFALLMLPFSTAAFDGAREGIKLFAGSVLPALFPFMVCSHYIMRSSVLSRLRGRSGALVKLAAFVLSAICGTPSSAVITRELFSSGVFERKRASVICAAFNMTGPLFIVSTLCGAMLKNSAFAYAFAVSHYLPPLIFALIPSTKSGRLPPSPPSSPIKKDAPLRLFSEAVSDAVLTVLRAGGVIVFFRILLSLADAVGALNSFPLEARGLTIGLLEMTNGVGLLAEAPSRLSLSFCAFLLSFGGASFFIQAKLIFPELSAGSYFLIKLLCGVASGISFWFVFPFVPVPAETLWDMSESLNEALPSLGSRLAPFLCGCAATGAALIVSMLYSKLARAKK